MSTIDTNIYTFSNLLGDDIVGSSSFSVQDFFEMDEAERQALMEQWLSAYQQAHDLDDSELTELADEITNQLDAELDALYDIVAEQIDQLTAIVESSSSAVYQQALDDLLALEPLLKSNLSSDWGSAVEEHQEKNVVVGSGETYTHNPSDPEEGETYYIDATSTDTQDSFFEDGSNEADTNGDGIADVDVDGNGVIDDEDMYPQSDPAVVTLEGMDEITYEGYSEGPPASMTFTAVKDGVEYEIVILVDEFTRINCDTMPTNLDDMPDQALAKMYEFTDSEHSYYYHINGSELKDNNLSYAIYNADDYANHEIPAIQPSDEDYEDGTVYYIHFDENTASNTLNLIFEENVDLDFKIKDGTLYIYATNPQGEKVTYKIDGWGAGDVINIDGGEIDPNDYVDLAAANRTQSSAGSGEMNIAANILFHNGSEQSVWETAEDEGYPMHDYYRTWRDEHHA